MKLNRFFTAFFCFYILTAVQLWSQKTADEFIFVNLKDGMSKVAISTITQDNYGYIWIGTNGKGVYKFDGVEYVSYKYESTDSLSVNSSLIHCSYLDKKNRLWVGTENGINVYDRRIDKFKRIEFSKKQKGDSNNISVASVTGDEDGNIYLGTFGKGLFKLNSNTFNIEKIENNIKDVTESTNLTVNNLKIDAFGKVFAGTNLGLKEYNSITNKLETSFFKSIGNTIFSIDDHVQSILIDDKNQLWIGSYDNGLFKIKRGETSVKDHYTLTEKRVLSMIQNVDGTLLVGTENDGLLHIKQNGILIKNYLLDKTDKNSIRSNSIWSLFLDNNQRIWMGYYNSGIGLYDKLFDKFNGLESLPNNLNSLQAPSVTGIVEDNQGNLWFSMDGGGIDIYNPRKRTFKHINPSSKNEYSGLTSYDIQSVFIDSKQNVWVGSWSNGLYFLKKGTKNFINFDTEKLPKIFKSNSILSFAEDSKGTIWIGSFYNGILSYNPKTNKFKHHDSKPFKENEIHISAVRKLLVDSNDNLWIGTTKGLFKVKQINEHDFLIESMIPKMSKNNKNITSANHILTLFEDSKGKLWIGTRGAGLCRFDAKEDTFTWYNGTYNINEENISAIVESSDENLWFTGNSGIYKIKLDSNKAINYDANDGLLSDDFNINAALKSSNDILYFGNYKGVDYFKTNLLYTNKEVPSLYFRGFKLFNKNIIPNQKNSPLTKVITETDSIVLNHKQSVFTIEYSGVSYTRPEKNQYAYYLEGLVDTWNYVGNSRSASYTNLDPGDYVFKVKAANNDGVWNEEPITLKIKILPPWWRTNWAIISYCLLLFFALYILNKLTRDRIKERELIKNERDKRTQEDELNEKKIQFFTNISHEFRTPLTLIINPLKDIIEDKSLALPQRVKEKHSIIHKNTDRLYRLINELMDFRKLELNKVRIRATKISLVEFTKDVVNYFKEEALNKNIHLTVDADFYDISLWADEKMLEKIIFNILSNAVKVTPQDGTINVELSAKEELLILPLIDEKKPVKVIEISISDTGPGMKKKEANKIFERFYQVEDFNKTYYGGTGIGLEVVQNFVQLHKGKIEVESVLGEGTKFRILFPVGKKHFNDDQISSHKSENIVQNDLITEEAGIETESFSKEEVTDEIEIISSKTNTLLIVEDNIELRDYLKSELSLTYKVLTASDGVEGLKKAEDILPDVIITDVIMPKMDGFEFCGKIKSNVKTSHIPLLMLTAKTRIDDRIEGIGLGADAYMVKPFDIRLLKLRLSQLITSRKLIFDKYFGAISGSAENMNTTSIDKDFIQKILFYIHENISDSELSVEVLASKFNLSRSQLYRKIKTLTGQTVNEFIRKIRLQKAKQILETGSANVSEVCYKVGFSTPSYFTKCFKAHFGILPTDVAVNSDN